MTDPVPPGAPVASWVPVPDESPFPIQNLPLGIGADDDGLRTWVAIGDHALDLAAVQRAALLHDLTLPAGCFSEGALNTFLSSGPEAWTATRRRLSDLLADDTYAPALEPMLTPLAELTMTVPVAVGDYVDFYSSLHHATNLGRLFRPDAEPLLPNWRHLPIGYHGRSGTLIPTNHTIPRPRGLRLVDGQPIHGPTEALDIELEVGTVIGVGSRRGQPIPAAAAGAHLYGLCLVNDWSARDIQAYEYQPLGPFLGKSFATSVAPWLVSFEALAPHRVEPPTQHPPPAPYLRTEEPWGFDLHLEVQLESAAMRERGIPPVTVSRAGFADMYWTPAQQLAHLTTNGASVRPGDLFASGTVSGPTSGSEGSFIELTWRGERPLDLPDGTRRSFLADGDRVTLRGWAGGDGETRIGLGEVSGTIIEPTKG